MLNKAFRQHNIDLMFLFGFFVQDFYRKVKAEHGKQFILTHLDNPILKVYRGQTTSRSEIDDIGEWADSLVVNSYFSTTLNRSSAIACLNPSLEYYDQSQSVLFEIEIDTRYKCPLYANISNLSPFPKESEILFTIGTQFHIIDSIYNYDEKIWIVKLKLMNDKNMKNEKYFEKQTLKNCAIRLSSNDFNG
jgi:hypothetical protein